MVIVHHSARCTEVQSDIDKKQERRLALCYLKSNGHAIIRQTLISQTDHLTDYGLSDEHET